VIHILLKALSEETVAPPIQHENCLLCGAMSVGLISFAKLF